MDFMLILSCLISIQGREPNIGDFIDKNNNKLMLACIQMFIDGFLSNLI